MDGLWMVTECYGSVINGYGWLRMVTELVMDGY